MHRLGLYLEDEALEGQLVLKKPNSNLRHSGMFLAGIQVFGR
jgi:hypothetical protein